MATLSPSEIRQFVYDHLDVESDEIPSSVLDVFMQDGYNRIVATFDFQPLWLHVEYTFSTIAGTQSYDLDTQTGLTDPAPLQHIEDIRGPQWSLRPQQHRIAREAWQQQSATTGPPTEFSVWGRSLYLWPTPAASQSFTVTGTRQPIDWLALNTAPDCPSEFHRAIADYTLGRTYVQQDDFETGAVLLDAFKAQVDLLGRRWNDGSTAQPLLMGGGGRRDLFRTEKVLGPLVYPWE